MEEKEDVAGVNKDARQLLEISNWWLQTRIFGVLRRETGCYTVVDNEVRIELAGTI